MFGQELLQARFLDRRDVIVDLFDKGRIGVDTNDVIALGRKHGHDRSTELTQPDDRDFHFFPTQNSQLNPEQYPITILPTPPRQPSSLPAKPRGARQRPLAYPKVPRILGINVEGAQVDCSPLPAPPHPRIARHETTNRRRRWRGNLVGRGWKIRFAGMPHTADGLLHHRRLRPPGRSILPGDLALTGYGDNKSTKLSAAPTIWRNGLRSPCHTLD